jgi:hypothetical protein
VIRNQYNGTRRDHGRPAGARYTVLKLVSIVTSMLTAE